ncbi:hypothetical protein ON010_g4044 [Phytophthora cinnamomi]|nr:hypothetical protein ON010_g4044 [Phytophthora cinnamomi]
MTSSSDDEGAMQATRACGMVATTLAKPPTPIRRKRRLFTDAAGNIKANPPKKTCVARKLSRILKEGERLTSTEYLCKPC